MDDKELRNLAMMLASQLPAERDDAYLVMELMRELLDKWLYRGKLMYPPERSVISENYYEDILRERERTAGEGSSGSTSSVIKLFGKDDKSPR